MATKSEIVTLNVGGTLFTTTLTTLRQYPGSVLANMFDEDSDRLPAMKVFGITRYLVKCDCKKSQ